MHAGVCSHASKICIKQAFQRVRILLFMPKPARTDRHIDLGRRKGQPFGIQDIGDRPKLLLRIVKPAQLPVLRHRTCARLDFAEMAQLRRDDRPLRMAAVPRFVAAPAHVRPKIVKDHGVRLIFADQLDISGEVVFLLFAVRAFPAGIVKPHIKNIAVFRQKLRQLIAEIIVVFRRAVALGVSVPRRQIKTEFDAASFAGFRRFPHHILFARAVFDRMLGILRGPQAKSVVMLRGQHHALHSGGLDRFHPLVAVQLFRIKNRLVLGSVSPFAIHKGVYPKVDERIAFQLKPVKLAL